MARVRLCLSLALAVVGLAACGGASRPAAGEVEELRSLDQVASAFEADRGRPRLLLLLSPT